MKPFIFFMCSLILASCSASTSSTPPRSEVEFTALDRRARPVSLSSFRGHPILLTFWASWCNFCVAELPMFQKIWESYREQGLVVLGVAVDDQMKEALRTASTARLTFPILVDVHGEAKAAFQLSNVPTTVFIDAKGNIAPFVDPATDQMTNAAMGPRHWLRKNFLRFLTETCIVNSMTYNRPESYRLTAH